MDWWNHNGLLVGMWGAPEANRCIFHGTKGRLEQKEEERMFLAKGMFRPHAVKAEGTCIRIHPMRAPAYTGGV